jgi:hypothetical protein
MKTIYITEDIAKEISEISKPISDLPSDIKNVLRNHKTSLGMHPAFPPEEELSFDMLMTQSRFDEIAARIKSVNINDYSETTIKKRIVDILKRCKEIEKDFKEQLENICYNYIIDLFKVPDGLIAFECHLVEKVNDDKVPVNNKETFVFNNIPHRERLQNAVYKRRIINAIITGGALRLSYIKKDLIGELYELSPELPSLYRDFMFLNDYLLFTKNNIGISEKNKKQTGVSYLTIGNEITKNEIIAEGEIFPVLLYESIRGFLEMFAAYGLPSSKEECKYVMEKADFINAEPWDMRIGPALWDKLIDAFEEPDTSDLPMILTLLFSQSTHKFNSILQEIFGDTKRGEYLAKKILIKVDEEKEKDDFDKLMTKKQTDNTIINDEYYRPEEL